MKKILIQQSKLPIRELSNNSDGSGSKQINDNPGIVNLELGA